MCVKKSWDSVSPGIESTAQWNRLAQSLQAHWVRTKYFTNSSTCSLILLVVTLLVQQLHSKNLLEKCALDTQFVYQITAHEEFWMFCNWTFFVVVGLCSVMLHYECWEIKFAFFKKHWLCLAVLAVHMLHQQKLWLWVERSSAAQTSLSKSDFY